MHARRHAAPATAAQHSAAQGDRRQLRGARARGSRKRQALPLRLREDSPGDASLDASILALPADLLVHVFSKLDLKAHRFVLPLVCKQWWAYAFPIASSCTTLALSDTTGHTQLAILNATHGIVTHISPHTAADCCITSLAPPCVQCF